MEKWTISNKSGDFEGICERFSVTPLTARLLVNRGISSDSDIRAFLEPKLSDLHSAELLTGGREAARIIAQAIKEHKHIRIVGDYDVDGITSTYIFSDALRRAGAKASYYIPHRIKDGYGLNEEIIRTAANDGVSLVVTCDNGISAIPAALEAEKLGISLIVTDHHEIPDELPRALAIVDPKLENDTYPCRDICGAVVAAKISELIFKELGIDGSSADYIEFMALATICDVVPLLGENHAIASLGMQKLKNTGNYGLRCLMEESGVPIDELNEYHVGYIIGPCFNATGRIDDAGVALEMLMTADKEHARELAVLCRSLNEERKLITAQQEAVAYSILDASGCPDRVIVLELPDCHESILGIIAGRIRERYNKPAIVVTRSGDYYKGSGRSIPAYNMFEKLCEVSNLLYKFGGHPMAAGLSLLPENLDEFRQRLNEDCGLSDSDLTRKLVLDAEVSFSFITERNVEEIERLAPFGPGNPSVILAEKRLRIRNMAYMGKDSTHLRFKLVDRNNLEINAVKFGDASDVVSMLCDSFGDATVNAAFRGFSPYADYDRMPEIICAFVPKINVFRDTRTLQMQIKGIKCQN